MRTPATRRRRVSRATDAPVTRVMTSRDVHASARARAATRATWCACMSVVVCGSSLRVADDDATTSARDSSVPRPPRGLRLK